jgi:hypothetical protein
MSLCFSASVGLVPGRDRFNSTGTRGHDDQVSPSGEWAQPIAFNALRESERANACRRTQGRQLFTVVTLLIDLTRASMAAHSPQRVLTISITKNYNCPTTDTSLK